MTLIFFKPSLIGLTDVLSRILEAQELRLAPLDSLLVLRYFPCHADDFLLRWFLDLRSIAATHHDSPMSLLLVLSLLVATISSLLIGLSVRLLPTVHVLACGTALYFSLSSLHFFVQISAHEIFFRLFQVFRMPWTRGRHAGKLQKLQVTESLSRLLTLLQMVLSDISSESWKRSDRKD